MKKQVTSIAIIFLFLIGVFSGCVEETPEIKKNKIYVNNDGTADFISIQDAINASSDNGFIYVSKGTFYESLTINKPINLIGEGKDSTIISGRYIEEGIESLISIMTENCSIQGFTLKNGNNSLLDGINAVYSSNISIINNSIVGFNNGIYLTTSSNMNSISSNLVLSNTYGIRIQLSEYNTVSENNLINNTRGVFVCCSSEYNEIHFNNFFENHGFNGYETHELVNYWDNNYWDDYTGIDEDNDGYGDTPYNIPSGTNNDSKPLMNPFE